MYICIYIYIYMYAHTHIHKHTHIHTHSSGVPASTRQKAIREALRRWHPDKFGQKFGANLYEAHRDKILAKVKVVSQALTASM